MQETQRIDMPESIRRELFSGNSDKDLHRQMNDRLTYLGEELVGRTKLHDRASCPCGSGKIFKNCCKGKDTIPGRKQYTNEQVMERVMALENKINHIFDGHVLINGRWVKL